MMKKFEQLTLFNEISYEESVKVSGGFLNNNVQPNLSFFQTREDNIYFLSSAMFGDRNLLANILGYNQR